LTCGCLSITVSASSASASGSITRCSGICTTSGLSSSCQAARCFTAAGRLGSRVASHGLSRRCASASRATSSGACAS
jgi:hypothetical protein